MLYVYVLFPRLGFGQHISVNRRSGDCVLCVVTYYHYFNHLLCHIRSCGKYPQVLEIQSYQIRVLWIIIPNLINNPFITQRIHVVTYTKYERYQNQHLTRSSEKHIKIPHRYFLLIRNYNVYFWMVNKPYATCIHLSSYPTKESYTTLRVLHKRYCTSMFWLFSMFDLYSKPSDIWRHITRSSTSLWTRRSVIFQ